MDDSTPHQMYLDAAATRAHLHLDAPADPRLERAAEKAVSGEVPSLHFEDFPREVAKREIRVSEAATRLANALHLHLD